VNVSDAPIFRKADGKRVGPVGLLLLVFDRPGCGILQHAASLAWRNVDSKVLDDDAIARRRAYSGVA
jgi:hypothetical protein